MQLGIWLYFPLNVALSDQEKEIHLTENLQG